MNLFLVPFMLICTKSSAGNLNTLYMFFYIKLLKLHKMSSVLGGAVVMTSRETFQG